MYERLLLIKELLATSGTLYLHLDTNRGYMLRLVLDEVLGSNGFRNEIAWQRTTAHADTSGRFGEIHDTILASRARRSGVALHLREKGLLLVWQQADAAGPMSELERAMFIIDRLYPDMPPQHREQFQTQLAALAAAGRWHGFKRP